MSQCFDIKIRATEETDLGAVNGILNEAIANTNAYLSNKLKSIEDTRRWFEVHNTDDSYFALSALSDGVVVGWASVSAFREIEGYQPTAEVSVYIHPDYRGNGIADRLLKALEAEARIRHFHCLVSVITADNEISIRLHEKNGFDIQGILKESATKNGKIFDVVFMGKVLR